MSRYLFTCIVLSVSLIATVSSSTCATPYASNQSVFQSSQLYLCTQAFDCLVTFCNCTGGTSFGAGCIGANVTAAVLEACAVSRATCTLSAGINNWNSNSTPCASWANNVSSLYVPFYSAHNSSNTNLSQSCMTDICSEITTSQPTLSSSINITHVCSFEGFSFPAPYTTTTVAPTTTSTPTAAPTTAVPSGGLPITLVPPSTAIQVRISGSSWGTVLTKNISQVSNTVRSIIAAAYNVSESEVEILSLTVGSLVVQYQLGGASSYDSNNQLASQLSSSTVNLTSLVTLYRAVANTSESIALGAVTVVTTGGSSTYTIGNPSICGSACIGGVVVACVLGVAFICGVVYCVNAKCAKPKSIVEVSNEFASPTAAAANGSILGVSPDRWQFEPSGTRVRVVA